MSKLIEVLKKNIAKKDDQKAIEAAEKQVRTAKQASSNEVFAMETSVDEAEDKLEAVESNATSTVSDIIRAQDAVAVAKRNLEVAKGIVTARF